MPARKPRWHTFKVLGKPRKVRMASQYDAGGRIWRDYVDDRGQRVTVEARGLDRRRSAPETRTAMMAAEKLAGFR